MILQNLFNSDSRYSKTIFVSTKQPMQIKVPKIPKKSKSNKVSLIRTKLIMFSFWSVSLFGTVMTYGLFVDCRMLCIWLGFFVAYHGFGLWLGHSNHQTNRAKIRMATWNPPTDPNCYGKIEINLTNVEVL